jgi:hypothetical protein
VIPLPGARSLQRLLDERSKLVSAGARSYAYGQGAVLALAGLLSWAGGSATILHASGPAGDVAAWRTPFPGLAGALVTLAAAGSIVAALRLTTMREERLWARAGHVLLLGWGMLWVVGASRASAVEPDALFLAAQLASVAGFLCQGAVTWKTWPRSETQPAPDLVGSAAASTPPAADAGTRTAG